ncbi:MAG: hypothetical protein L3J59_07600 [Methylococcaceae bacterium]|nr:hypothetical protein [Methylococcaceae bacterium]
MTQNNSFISLLLITIILNALSVKINFHACLYRFTSTALVMIVSYFTMVDQETMALIFVIAAGIFLTVAGIKYREKIPFICCNLCVLGGTFFYWEYAINFYSSAPWICSIVLGLFVILLASYIENKEKQIMAKSRYYFNELKGWN